MKREILVFIFDGYADWESAYICSQINISETEYVIKTISFDKEPKLSMAGFRVIPDYSIDEMPKEFAMLLLLGGDAWQEKKNDKIKPVVEYAMKHNILIGAICGATFYLGEHGYLDNVKHTSNTLEFLKIQSPSYKGDCNYVERQSIRDGNIVTANGTATLEFTRELLLALEVKSEEEVNEWYEFHKRGFYKE